MVLTDSKSKASLSMSGYSFELLHKLKGPNIIGYSQLSIRRLHLSSSSHHKESLPSFEKMSM